MLLNPFFIIKFRTNMGVSDTTPFNPILLSSYNIFLNISSILIAMCFHRNAKQLKNTSNEPLLMTRELCFEESREHVIR